MGADADAALAALAGDRSRLLATLIRWTGDFDLAEDAVQQAFEDALEAWRRGGVPGHARAWLIQAARHIAIDRIRRRKNLEKKLQALGGEDEAALPPDPSEIPDDRLRLLFTCCHPSLAIEAQLALTLRTLCGLETEEIARAFLVPPATMAQRIVRAKKKIAEARIPYVLPETSEMPERLQAVLTVIYLVFNEGYAATRGERLVRVDLADEAIRLARTVRALMSPDPPSEVTALLALMLLHHSRRDARLDATGDLVLLDQQDRAKWDRAAIAEALPLVEEALRGGLGPYALQAAIAAVHARATQKDDTDWSEIAGLYEILERVEPSPVVTLNRAVAIAMVDGPSAGLAIADGLVEALDSYHLLHAVRADLFRRLGAFEQAAASYRRALALVGNESERRFLTRRLRELPRAG